MEIVNKTEKEHCHLVVDLFSMQNMKIEVFFLLSMEDYGIYAGQGTADSIISTWTVHKI